MRQSIFSTARKAMMKLLLMFIGMVMFWLVVFNEAGVHKSSPSPQAETNYTVTDVTRCVVNNSPLTECANDRPDAPMPMPAK